MCAAMRWHTAAASWRGGGRTASSSAAVAAPCTSLQPVPSSSLFSNIDVLATWCHWRSACASSGTRSRYGTSGRSGRTVLARACRKKAWKAAPPCWLAQVRRGGCRTALLRKRCASRLKRACACLALAAAAASAAVAAPCGSAAAVCSAAPLPCAVASDALLTSASLQRMRLPGCACMPSRASEACTASLRCRLQPLSGWRPPAAAREKAAPASSGNTAALQRWRLLARSPSSGAPARFRLARQVCEAVRLPAWRPLPAGELYADCTSGSPWCSSPSRRPLPENVPDTEQSRAPSPSQYTLQANFGHFSRLDVAGPAWAGPQGPAGLNSRSTACGPAGTCVEPKRDATALC